MTEEKNSAHQQAKYAVMDACLTDWKTPPPPIPEEAYSAVFETDVVIVGAGQSGTCAARSAAEAGASVIVIDKQHRDRQRILGAQVGTINSAFSRQRGIRQYEPSEFMQELERRTHFRAEPTLLREYAFHSGETLDWFLESLSQEQRDGLSFFMQDPPRHSLEYVGGARFFAGTLIFGGSCTMEQAIKLNHRTAEARGAQFHFERDAEQLLLEDGKVVGVAARGTDGAYYKYVARNGVLLAAGDFSANSAMVYELMPEVRRLNNGRVVKGMGWDGRGIRMGLWAGGRLEPGPLGLEGGNYVQIGGPCGWAFTLTLNQAGERFADECNGRLLAARQPGDVLYCVWDADWRAHLEYQPIAHGSTDPHDPMTVEALKGMDQVPAAGSQGMKLRVPHAMPTTYFAADTYEQLAEYLGLEGERAASFCASIRRYNELAQAGKDLDFGRDPNTMFPLTKPPFYGCQLDKNAPKMEVTHGGLWVDGQQRVLDSQLRPISGLYATGNCGGNREGSDYFPAISGLSVGMCHTLGRLAGQALAQARR